MNTSRVENEFSKYAKDYNNNNIIQQIIAKALVRDIKSKPSTILELGCGSGQIFKYIDWNIEKYTAIDFSSEMCKLHPKKENVEVFCFDFDSKEFEEFLKDKKFDMIISSSAMQWSNDLDKLVEKLSLTTNEINCVLFTSNTFKTIQNITKQNSPILDINTIKKSFSNHLSCEFEVFNYNLEFENKKDIFEYIKKSGVEGGGDKLSFKDAKRLYKEYPLSYLEFEVIFIKAKK
jgi:malonyl-CoA O-methyltransferase